MRKEKSAKVKVAVILDSEQKVLIDLLNKLPDNWDVMVAPTSRLSDILKFAPNVLIFRGSLDNPILSFVREMKIPKIILLPIGLTEFWDTVVLEPDWLILGKEEGDIMVSRLKEIIKSLL